MRRLALPMLYVLVALLPGASPARAQTPAPAESAPTLRTSPPRPFWLNVGLGAASDEMIAAAASLTVARSAARVVTVRTFVAEEWQWCWGGPCAAPPDQNLDVGVLYGVAHQARWLVVSVAAGAGVASVRRTTYEPTRTTRALALSVPLEGQLFVRPLRNVGLGVSAMASVNHEHPFGGVVVGLQLGRLTPPWGAASPRP
jgi:hypothetical protein